VLFPYSTRKAWGCLTRFKYSTLRTYFPDQGNKHQMARPELWSPVRTPAPIPSHAGCRCVSTAAWVPIHLSIETKQGATTTANAMRDETWASGAKIGGRRNISCGSKRSSSTSNMYGCARTFMSTSRQTRWRWIVNELAWGVKQQ